MGMGRTVGTQTGWETLVALWLWVQALCQGMLKGQLDGQAGPTLWHSLHGLTWVQVLPSETVHTCSPRTLRSKQEDQKFIVTLVYLVVLRLAWAP